MRKLGRKKAHRNSLIRNLATSLLLYEKVDTTESKAKELKREVESIISKAKINSMDIKRSIYGRLFDTNASKKLFDELIIRYKDRSSGYIEMTKFDNRMGDNSKMVRLELIDKKKFISQDNNKNDIKIDIKEKKSKSKNTSTIAEKKD